MISSEGVSQLDTPFGGGVEVPYGISMVIYCHVGYPLDVVQLHTHIHIHIQPRI